MTVGLAGARRLCVVTHVSHYRCGGRLHAYAPYAREIEVWADLFPELVIAAPCLDTAPPGDAAPIDRPNVTLAPQLRTGGERVGDKLRQILLLPVLVLRLAGALRHADAIHVRCPGNLGLLAAVLAPIFSRRLYAKFAGQWSNYPGEPRTVRLQKALLRSRWWGGPVTVYGEWPGQPPHVVPFFSTALDGAQLERARAAAARRQGPLSRVLFVGRLSREKNVDELLGALVHLRREGLRPACTIVGDGPHRPVLEERIAREELGDQVELAGAMDLDGVLNWYERSDILVLASATEGWPKAVVEAMAFGLVCIASDRGLMSSILGDGRGLLVPPGEEEALAAALRRVLSDAAGAREMGSRAAAWAGRFSRDSLREALRTLLTESWGLEKAS